jgi:hypothetical protein
VSPKALGMGWLVGGWVDGGARGTDASPRLQVCGCVCVGGGEGGLCQQRPKHKQQQ